ncbi:MAG: hypothetical protein ICV77_18120, partial [Cyanobacteria bacterium Co-bin8]|nr:hypothetical protein [Cyanobacteria bacterium Co-bin8]
AEDVSASDFFEATEIQEEAGLDGSEIRDDFLDAAPTGFVKEDIVDISPQPSPFPSVEVSRPDRKLKGK